jgi:hypothetical protein
MNKMHSISSWAVDAVGAVDAIGAVDTIGDGDDGDAPAVLLVLISWCQ